MGRLASHSLVQGEISRAMRNSEEVDQAAAALEVLEDSELLALARRASGAGTWDYDLKAGIARFCPRSLEILGHRPDRSPVLTGLEWAQHIFPGDAERVLEQGRRARDARVDFVTEYRIVRPDGDIRWVRGHGRTLRNAEDEPVRSVGFNFDVTEQKRAEEKLRQVQSELIHISRVSAMGTMAETLAHELNQPLASIGNYLAAARKLIDALPSAEGERIRHACTLALESTHRAGEIIRRLRAMTRRDKSDRGWAELGETMREGLALALMGADERGIAIIIAIDSGLRIEADHIQIQQVVLNLVRNAVEAMQDCPDPCLQVRARAEGNRAIVRIEDNGTGIPEETRARLFEPFVSAKPDGMGVGLSISRTIIEAHGGQLWAEHPPEGGAVFCFSLPLCEAPLGHDLTDAMPI